jgi:hypothetical protein
MVHKHISAKAQWLKTTVRWWVFPTYITYPSGVGRRICATSLRIKVDKPSTTGNITKCCDKEKA